MEPKTPGSGTIAADQTAAAKPPTTNTTSTTTKSQGTGRTTNQGSTSLSPPGSKQSQQGTYDQSDGR